MTQGNEQTGLVVKGGQCRRCRRTSTLDESSAHDISGCEIVRAAAVGIAFWIQLLWCGVGT